MKSHVCPWWLCFSFDNALRRPLQNPYAILGPYLREGNTVLDVGPGRGYFTLPMAKMVGESGRVVAADLQEKMLASIRKRAKRAGLLTRIALHHCAPDTLGLDAKFDFILAFWMVHEVPDRSHLLTELRSLLKEKGTFLLVEPLVHVTKKAFEETVALSGRAGFVLRGRPKVFLSQCALFSTGKAA